MAKCALLVGLMAAALLSACGGDNGTAPVIVDETSGPKFTWQNPLPHANRYLSMERLDGGRLMAISPFDALATGDDGESWQSLGLEGPFVSSSRQGSAVAVLTQTHVYISSDGGDSWRRTARHGVDGCRAVSFLDGDHGVVTGDNGAAVTTEDGGGTWTARFTGTSYRLSYAGYIADRVLLATGTNATLIRSTNGGQTWGQIMTGGGTVLGMDVTAGIVRTVDGEGDVFTSTDAGAKWTEKDDTGSLYDIHFFDAVRGVVGGADGLVRVTTNGGVSWTDRSIAELDLRIDAVCQATSDQVWAAGVDGRIYRSDDAGMSWRSVHRGGRALLYGVSFADEQTGIAVGNVELINGVPRCGVFRTDDGGRTWGRGVLGDLAVCLAGNLTSVWMLDAMRAVAVGYDGDAWTTDDGGRTWTFRDTGTTDALYDVAFADENTGIAVGNNGRKRHTSDGGVTWTAGVTGTGTTKAIRRVAYGSPTTLVFVGSQGNIRKSTNGGQFWGDLAANIPDNYYVDVAMLDESTIIVLGEGTDDVPVYRSTDGGESWDVITIAGSTVPDGALAFADESRGYLVMDSGDIYFTDDGGAAWDRQPKVADDLFGICTIGRDVATAVGSNGTIIRIER